MEARFPEQAGYRSQRETRLIGELVQGVVLSKRANLVPPSSPQPPLPAYRTSRHVICEGTADGHLAPCHLAPAHTQDEEDRLACLLVKERHEHEEARVAALEGSAAAGLAAEGPPMPGGGAASRKKCMSGMLRRAGKTREDFPTVQMTRAIDESNRELAQEVR